jgi:alcohol dehydrogenase (cytochrome c)
MPANSRLPSSTTALCHQAKWTFAINVETGRQVWRTPVQYEPGSTRATSAIYRGAPAFSRHGGQPPRRETGSVLWNQKYAEAKEGYYSSGAPIVANGLC